MLGDNVSMVLNRILMSSILKKNQHVIEYHHVREYVSGGVINLVHERSENNYADLMIKALSEAKNYALCKPLMFTEMIGIKDRNEGSDRKAKN